MRKNYSEFLLSRLPEGSREGSLLSRLPSFPGNVPGKINANRLILQDLNLPDFCLPKKAGKPASPTLPRDSRVTGVTPTERGSLGTDPLRGRKRGRAFFARAPQGIPLWKS